MEITKEKDRFVLELAQDNKEKDVVFDKVIKENSEIAQEKKDLVEEIDESVEIAQQKDISLGLFPGGWRTIDAEDLIIPEDRSLEAIDYNFNYYEFFNSTSELKRSSSSNQRYVYIN